MHTRPYDCCHGENIYRDQAEEGRCPVCEFHGLERERERREGGLDEEVRGGGGVGGGGGVVVISGSADSVTIEVVR